jgi:hypothetical protein
MYSGLRQIGVNFRAYHKFYRSSDSQFMCSWLIFGFQASYMYPELHQIGADF